jgi:cellulose biosynthesis protein BcsQ
MPKKESWQISLKRELTEIYVQNPQEWVELNISTAGLLNLRIVSNKFKELPVPQRKEELENILGQYKISPGFISLYTVKEARSLNLSPPQQTDENSINTWQDLALWAANPQNHLPFSQPKPTLPRTVTFYSFKGGVGRTTALIHVAWILAMRGRKVVAVDLDLEAPGLSTAFTLNPQPEYGIVDYFYERSYGPEGVEPNISITKIFGEVTIPNAPGRLFVVPAGFLSLDYISQVDDLRATTIVDRGEGLWSVFRREIQQQLKPDIILVDSRTGINEWGALSLLQAADEAVIFLFPNEQHLQGTKLLLSSLNSLGKLSMELVFSLVPDLRAVEVKKMWQHLLEVSDRQTDENAEPLIIPYLPSIALANDYPVVDVLDYYNKIADSLDENANKIRLGEFLTGTLQF